MSAELVLRILRAFYVPLVVLVIVLGCGTIGFLYLGGPKVSALDALYMTYITIFTIGYDEVIPLHDNPAGRIFNMAIATIGIGAVGYVMARTTAFIVESDINEIFRRRRMLDKIRNLSGHYLICGIGRVGSNVLRELVATGRQSVVIEPERSALEAMLEAHPKQVYLHGDGAADDLLLAAGVERAAGVFAVSGDDNKNLVITLSAKQLNPRARVVARCHEVRFVEKIRRVGADDIVSPDYTGALRIASSMLRPAVVSFLDEMLRTDKGLRVEEVVVPPAARERRISDACPAGRRLRGARPAPRRALGVQSGRGCDRGAGKHAHRHGDPRRPCQARAPDARLKVSRRRAARRRAAARARPCPRAPDRA